MTANRSVNVRAKQQLSYQHILLDFSLRVAGFAPGHLSLRPKNLLLLDRSIDRPENGSRRDDRKGYLINRSWLKSALGGSRTLSLYNLICQTYSQWLWC